MDRENKFSARFGFEETEQTEIKVRHDAPSELRSALPVIVEKNDLSPKPLRKIICKVLLISPNPNNWSEYPNIEHEVNELLENCKWYEVYDIIEAIYKYLYESAYAEADKFERNINKFFIKNGIGWKLNNGLLEIRGAEYFEESVKEAIETLQDENKDIAKDEINKALQDLSKRPEPDLTGAVQHSMAALECIARDVADSNDTLGSLIRRNRSLFPSPLDSAVEKLWGFASEYGRHLRENRELDFKDVELVVSLCSILSSYLAKKFHQV